MSETREFLSKQSLHEAMDAYLTIGGIPEYLRYCQTNSSVFTSICQNSFTPDSFFAKEYERIFISSLADNKHYKIIIEFLAKRRFASRNEILKHLKIKSSGSITDILNDLVLCGFIERYTPYNLASNSKLARYCISDNYLRFYYKFIKPISDNIMQGDYTDNPVSAIQVNTYQKWLGYAFERFCRQQHRLISKLLGFSAVRYRSGAYFNREIESEAPGYQIDLLFDRDDKVITVCEVKYRQGKIGTEIIEQFERKLHYLPNQGNKTLHKVLIAANGIDKVLASRHYFDQVIILDDF